MQFYEINICQVMIFRFYTVYNKHEMKKNGIQNRKIANIIANARIILLSNILSHFDSLFRLEIYEKTGTQRILLHCFLVKYPQFSTWPLSFSVISNFLACLDQLFTRNNIFH